MRPHAKSGSKDGDHAATAMMDEHELLFDELVRLFIGLEARDDHDAVGDPGLIAMLTNPNLTYMLHRPRSSRRRGVVQCHLRRRRVAL